MRQYLTGKGIVDFAGRRVTPDGEEFGFDAETQADYDRMLAKLNTLVERVPRNSPWPLPTLTSWRTSRWNSGCAKMFTMKRSSG